jgi:hypothetical protein
MTGTGHPLILSASRRTDLPGFHPSSCAERIRNRISRLRTRKLVGVVYWTRHIRPFLPGGPLHRLTAIELENPIVNFTVTGLGGTEIEPGVPPMQQVLDELPGLVEAFHSEPWRIRWRFDPLLFEWSSVETFETIGRSMAASGISTCTFSFPAYGSLKGNLTPQFENAGIARWPRSEKAGFLGQMVRVAGELGIQLLSCCQPENLELTRGVKPAQCIPAEALQRGLSTVDFAQMSVDRSQRKHCRCIPSEDIGD